MPPPLTELDKKVFEAVATNPGRKAIAIAQSLGMDRTKVNASLHGALRSKVRQDRAYRWYPQAAAPPPQPVMSNTPLAQLCRYYLDCLSHDDLGGASVFAAPHHGTPSYAELRSSPSADEFDPFDSDEARGQLAKVRANPRQLALFVGYPTRLKFVRGRTGWEGFFVEPLLLFPFQDSQMPPDVPELSGDLPQINFSALRSLSKIPEAGLMGEAIQLAEELGLGNEPGERPDVDELLQRLRDLRPEWDWQEQIDPYSLSAGLPISEINQQGIFNRCILLTAERSKFVVGLESELGSLQSCEEATYCGTALGQWLSKDLIESPLPAQLPLLETLSLNTEQRQAVRQALANPLTVITGPPGTGKSQVVASILINAAYQGKTVLFASKNNKAVDVVETRVNALGPRPILLRLGANKFQDALAHYLVCLLGTTATKEDASDFEEAKALHAQAEARSSALDLEFEALIDLRNQVDKLEQEIEPLRLDLGNVTFGKLRTLDAHSFEKSVLRVQSTIHALDKSRQSFVIRLIWPLISKRRLSRLAAAADLVAQSFCQLISPMPVVEDSAIGAWVEYDAHLAQRLAQVIKAKHYFEKLDKLGRKNPIEELTRRRGLLTADLSEFSERLWRAWLRLQPARMTPAQRRLIGNYAALLQMIAAANANGSRLGAGVFSRYYQLFPQITSILPCWAITALAARGKLPFSPGFFDLLVIDEASQCDIASALPLLFRAKQAVIIGDSMQLPHICGITKQQDSQLLSKHGLLENRPGWSYSSKSLFALAASLCGKPEDVVMIRDHFRSHSDIIQFSNRTFYDERLRLATPYERLRVPHPKDPAIRWVDVQGDVVRPGSGGAVNESEAQAVISEIERLVDQGYKGSIGVVSPFRAQANRIRDIVSQKQRLAAPLANADFLADVVHSFQGDERDVILFSPVVSRNTPRGALWFVDSNEHKKNLFNVSITRARAALIVVGDRNAIRGCESKHLKDFVAYTDRLASLREPEPSESPKDPGEMYPIVGNPENVSPWERQFYGPLYRRLKVHGVFPMPQYAVDKYYLDFALKDGERRLDIEIDGERYHRNWDGELCRRDQIRNLRLIEIGWDVMRFWVYQVRDDLDGCLDRVEAWWDNGSDCQMPRPSSSQP